MLYSSVVDGWATLDLPGMETKYLGSKEENGNVASQDITWASGLLPKNNGN
jgi:hypothetical protein